ncbi:uncharacterized protein LOC131327735 [Rhododendron vialii]|uniref:uncharacterized protein LOC131327735 n=1 Tax=Rhododendron vialii TaxID=182163 RepID=UPI00265DDC84|nr:uncharacterized protein LOC131327735 [Rhododendron vialii]
MEVQCVAAAPTPVIEDVGVLAEQWSTEELIRFSIPGEEGRYFLIGNSLSMAEREEMYQFLMRNIEVFAWTPQDMPGVDPSFAMHSLNVDPNRRPVVQKVRRSSATHTEAVIAEVNQLLEAGVIREVLYPTWLANPVVVPKKNGKIRVCVDYTNLNDACPMDRFPLPRIEQMVDATAGCERLSFMDAYRGYHQIALDPEDQEKTAFISPRGTFCYKVVPFGLKNAGATFQRSITKMFPSMLGVKVEAYIDDLVCRSLFARDHLRDLGEVFAVLKHRKLRLNAKKCAFGVSSGKFLGYMVSRRGIEADPTQILAVQRLRAPTTIKEVQRLTGMVAALNRFIRRSSDLCRSFFRAITTSRRRFVWTEECEQALQSLKQYLSHAPLLVKPLPDEDLYLYLVVSDHATSAVLVRKEGLEHQPIFYSSKTMMDSQTRIVVLTEFPLRAVLRKTDTSSRILKFSQDLANFDIQFEPRTAIKGQALADFFAELTLGLQDEANALATGVEEARKREEEVLEGPSNCPSEPLRARAGAGIVLVSPSGTVHESVVSIGYPATNNEAEYEALIAGLQLALRLNADSVHVFCDSQLIVGHLNEDYQAKDQRMNAYVCHVLALFGGFGRVEVEWIAREHNAHADALAGLVSVYKTSGGRTITFDEVATPSFERPCEQVMAISLGLSQLDPVIAYLKNQVVPTNKREAYKLRCRAANFFLGPNDDLYRRTFTGPDLRVVHDDLVQAVLEELHSGSCGAHLGGRSLAHRALTHGYWWPKMVKQSEDYVKQYNNALVGAELDLAEELRDNANLRHAAYQQEVARGYNRNVRA